MMNKVKLSLDAAVYEYSSVVWEELTGLTPESVVSNISAGKGVVGRADDVIIDQLRQFLPRVDRFVPRVRLDCEDADVYSVQCRTLIARWRRKLVNVRTSLLHNSKVIYLTDAVNQIMAKPYNDEIARLRSTIFEEQNLMKAGQELTEQQKEKVDAVNKKIEEQRRKLHEQPRCTNAILTSMLHEVIDDMPQDERTEIDRLVSERVRCKKELDEVKTALYEVRAAQRNMKKDATDEERNKLTTRGNELEEKLQTLEADAEQYRSQRLEILQKYYEHLKPEVVAESLMKAPSSFWECFNMKQTMTDVEVRIASSVKKSKASREDSEKPKARKARKVPTLAERTEALMLFPYTIGSADTGNISSQLLADSQLMDDYDQWTEQFPGKSITPEYRAKYAEFCRQFHTLPDSALAALSQEPAFVEQQRKAPQQPPQETNYDKLMAMLKKKAGSDATGNKALADNDHHFRALSERPDFARRLTEVEAVLAREKYVTAACSTIRQILQQPVLKEPDMDS